MEQALREKIIQHIDNYGTTQSFLARKLGISPQLMHSKIKGKVRFSVDEMQVLSDIIGFSIDCIAKKEVQN